MRHFVSGLMWAAFTATATFACDFDRIDVRGDWGTASFAIEVADDAAERGRGLMHRETMPRFSGMLFIYETPQSVSFWMKNTLIPLDLIFAGEDGVIDHIHEGARPHDLTAITAPGQIQFVLEVNAGMVHALGIEVGDEIRHTAIPPEIAVWSCQ